MTKWQAGTPTRKSHTVLQRPQQAPAADHGEGVSWSSSVASDGLVAQRSKPASIHVPNKWLMNEITALPEDWKLSEEALAPPCRHGRRQANDGVPTQRTAN